MINKKGSKFEISKNKLIDHYKTSTWIQKSAMTIIMGQLGIIVVIFVTGPAREIDLLQYFKDYIMQGSLLLSVMSISANIIGTYFFDKNNENEPLIFEVAKKELIFAILLLVLSSLYFASPPKEWRIYFLAAQIIIYIFSIYLFFRTNYIVNIKENGYYTVADEESKEISEQAKDIKNYDGIDFG